MWMKAFFYSQVLFYFRNLHICSKDEVKTNVVRISGTVSHDTAVHWTVLEQNRCFWWEAEPSGLHSGLTMAWLVWLETIRWEAGNLPPPPPSSLPQLSSSPPTSNSVTPHHLQTRGNYRYWQFKMEIKEDTEIFLCEIFTSGKYAWAFRHNTNYLLSTNYLQPLKPTQCNAKVPK